MIGTTWTIEQFRTDQERTYVIVTPFLAEVQRVSVNNVTKDYRGTHGKKV